MRLCLSCQSPLPESARADALYCDNKRCRSRAYRQRKKAIEAALPSSEPIESPAPQTFVVRCSCGNRLRIQVEHLGKAEDTASSSAVVTEENPPPEPIIVSTLRTYEIVAMHRGRAVPVASAFPPPGQHGRLRPGFEIVIADASSDGFGLAGIPGRWRDFYGDRSPAEFGLDADKAVMRWEPSEESGRGVAVSADALLRFFGPSWREIVY